MQLCRPDSHLWRQFRGTKFRRFCQLATGMFDQVRMADHEMSNVRYLLADACLWIRRPRSLLRKHPQHRPFVHRTEFSDKFAWLDCCSWDNRDTTQLIEAVIITTRERRGMQEQRSKHVLRFTCILERIHSKSTYLCPRHFPSNGLSHWAS